MNRLPPWFRSLTRVSYDYTDPYDHLRARGLLAITLSVLVIVLGVLVTLPLFGLQLVPLSGTVVVLLLFAAGLIGVLLLINRGQLILASLLYIILLFVA